MLHVHVGEGVGKMTYFTCKFGVNNRMFAYISERMGVIYIYI